MQCLLVLNMADILVSLREAGLSLMRLDGVID